MVTAPMITIRMEITIATMGRLMKNFDITSPPFGFTGAPGRILNSPSVTTRSPGFSPSSTTQSEPIRSPTLTTAKRIVLFGSTTATDSCLAFQ